MPDNNEKQKVQEQEIQIKERSSFIWFLVIMLVAGLILTTNKYKEEIQPAKKEIITKQIKEAPAEAKEPTAPEKEKFPLTTWLIIAGGLLLLRAGGEFYLAIKSGKTAIQWITPDMLSIGIGIITVIILVLQAFYPDQWWNNLCQSPLGTPLLFAFGAIILIWYILPGTGDITLKLGKPFCIIVGLGLMIILVFTATGGELKYEDKDDKDQWIWQKLFNDEEVETKIPPQIIPQTSYGWEVDNEGRLVASLRVGEEASRVFRMSEGYSTPWFVLPPKGYRFRTDHQQAVIVEEKGHGKKIVHPDDPDNRGVTQGEYRQFRFTALKGGAEIIITLRRK